MPKKDECREYLESYRYLVLDQIRREGSARTMRDIATKVTSQITGMPRGGGADNGELLASLTQAEIDALKGIQAALKRRKEVEEFIDRVDGEMNRQILKLRYINLMHWPEIIALFEEAGMPYSGRHIFNLHGRALAAARKKYEEEKL